MTWEKDQIMYNRLRKKKHSPTDAVRILRSLKLKPKHIKKRIKPRKATKRLKHKKLKTQKRKMTKLRHYRTDPEGYEDEMVDVDYVPPEPVEQRPPLSQRIDLGLQKERRDIAGEATVREVDRVSGNVRDEMRNTGEQLGLMKPKQVPNRPFRNWMSRAAPVIRQDVGQGYKKVRHPLRSIDEETARRLAQVDQEYQPGSEYTGGSEETTDYGGSDINYERRKRRKRNKKVKRPYTHRNKKRKKNR